MRRCLELLDAEVEPRLVAESQLTLVRLCWAAGDHAQGAEVSRALAVDAARVNHPLVESVAKGGLAVLSLGGGDLALAAATADEAVAVAEAMDGAGRAEAMGNALLARSVVHEAAGELDAAFDLQHRAALEAERADEWILDLAVAYYRGRVAFRLGRFDVAAEVASIAAQLADDIGVDAALFQHARTLGGARCALGDVDDGSALVGAADAHARAFGSVPGYANPSFAEEVDAVTDPVARCRGASWSRGELVDAVRHRYAAIRNADESGA